MKKTVALLMTLVCVCAILSAHAEGAFTLRNGVRFGDTWETIQSKETFERIQDGMPHIFQFKGDFCGMPSMVRYYFGENLANAPQPGDRMKSAAYIVNTQYKENGGTSYSRKSSFSKLCAMMCAKYGDAAVEADSLKNVNADPLISYYIFWLNAMHVDSFSDFDSLDSLHRQRAVWTVPAGGRTVVIEVQEYGVIQDGKNCFLTLVNYSAYTEKEMQSLQHKLFENLDDI